MALALTGAGDRVLELVELRRGEGLYSEHLDVRGGGLHHVACFWVEAAVPMGGRFEDAGMGVFQGGMDGPPDPAEGVVYYYLDAQDELNALSVETGRTATDRLTSTERTPANGTLLAAAPVVESMGYIVKMPKLGLEMERGTMLEWVIKPEEEIAEGDVIAEIESEKTIGQVEAREGGILRRTYLEPDETVPPGTPIGIVAAADADISDLESEAEAELEDSRVEPPPAGTEESPQMAAGTRATADETAPGTPAERPDDIKASPRAKKRAEDLGVELTEVDGTGPQGAVTADDVEAAARSGEDERQAVKASPRAKKLAEELGVDLTAVEGSGPQGAITADDVDAAASSEPEVSEELRRITPERDGGYRYQRFTAISDPAAAEALLETTQAVRSAFEERVTFLDVSLAVVSKTLADCPVVNATYSEQTHHLHERQRIALATDLVDDPRVAVIPDAHERSLTDLVSAREEFGKREREGPPTFTLADAANTGADELLVNPPCVACLAIDASGQRAIPASDGVKLQPLVRASLTYDTRAIGNADAEEFLERFFENASRASERVLDTYRGGE